MHPLKPYFRRRAAAAPAADRPARSPSARRTSTTSARRTRHLTFFEMLGNFSIGDYFKQGAVEFAWDLSLNGFGFDPERIWVTVFEGDDELGLGPDEEAIEAWLSIGVPRERIVPLPRGQLLAGRPDRAVRPVQRALPRPRPRVRRPDDLPGCDGERFLEYWNLVFMQYDQEPAGTLDAAAGAEHRHRAGPQPPGGDPAGHRRRCSRPTSSAADRRSARSCRGRATARRPDVDRALRILADHTRGMSFLIADGVVPSNEERGYVLRRLMRRAILQGRRIGIERGFLPRFADGRARADGRAPTPSCIEQRDDDRHVAARARRRRSGARSSRARAARRPHRAREGERARRASAPTTPSSCTTPTASRSSSRSSSPPSRAWASTSRASRS